MFFEYCVIVILRYQEPRARTMEHRSRIQPPNKRNRRDWLSAKKLERVRKRLERLGVEYGFDVKTARQLARV